MKNRNVAFYGGSFDPPHIGHAMVVSHLLLNDASIDRVVVMPCFQHLEKKGLTPFAYRYEMCMRAFGWLPRVEVSTLEEELGGGSLTVRTIRELKKRAWPHSLNVFVVMGSDLIKHAPEWEGWDELLHEATPLVVGRAGIPSESYDGEAVSKGGRRLKTPIYTPISPAVSSTEVRELLVAEKYDEVDRYLPKGVLDLIRERRLYAPKTT
jgi:nicotinate-nucleotide adenylyltransferase